MSVDIVLATFNGERYIREQLESLLIQTFNGVRVLIGDDGSSDGTMLILREYQDKYPDRIFLMEAPGGLGSCANFSFLLTKSTADYVFFADQDDVWDKDKVMVSLAAMRSMESMYGENAPLLVHSDLRVVDADLRFVEKSFFDFQRLKSTQASFCNLLFQNMVTGCSVLANRALIVKATPIPSGVVMHDWWLALIASAFGHIYCIDRSMLSYRQHSSNQVGAKGWSFEYFKKRFVQLCDRRSAAVLGFPVIRQAQSFYDRFHNELTPDNLLICAQVVSLTRRSPISRVMTALRIRAKKHGVIRTIALYWLLIRADFDQWH